MEIKVGDRVKINKYNAGHTTWYSEQIYTVVKMSYNTFFYESSNIAHLDRNLPNKYFNEVHVDYLILLKDERKKKLLNLNK